MSHITPSTDISRDDATGSPITDINRALGKRREPPSPLRQHAKALIASKTRMAYELVPRLT